MRESYFSERDSELVPELETVGEDGLAGVVEEEEESLEQRGGDFGLIDERDLVVAHNRESEVSQFENEGFIVYILDVGKHYVLEVVRQLHNDLRQRGRVVFDGLGERCLIEYFSELVSLEEVGEQLHGSEGVGLLVKKTQEEQSSLVVSDEPVTVTNPLSRTSQCCVFGILRGPIFFE